MKKFIVNLLIIFAGLFFIGQKTFGVGNYGPNWEKPVIQVYIPQNEYAGMMLQAFQTWANKCNGRLNFQYVLSSPADIEVEFADKTDGTDGDIGSYSLTIKGGTITKATITIAPNPQENSQNLIYTVMLHEVGHALGLKDSFRKLGIMSTPVLETQEIVNTDILKLYHLNGWTYINKNTSVIIAD